jgi:TRAP-type C4-dicarboxylate transport system permease small subunit
MRKDAPQGVQRLLETVGAASLAVLMVVVFIDVLGRNVFNRPLPWGTELLEVVLAVMIFALYPLLALRSTHITVDLVEAPERFKPAQRTLACAVGAALFAVIAWCTGRQALRSAAYGDASPLLQIPTAWVLWGMCALSAATVLAFLLAMGRRAPVAESFHGVAVN